jgi:Zinc-uptake complex component A periplasmic
LSGKHLEHYLEKVQQATGGKGESLSVGDELPNLKMKADPDEPQVKAIFLENTLNPKVTVELIKETGAKIGGTLYADGLGEGDGSTYDRMVRHNISTIVDSLK